VLSSLGVQVNDLSHYLDDKFVNNLYKHAYCVDWIDMAQDRDHWRAPLNMALNFRVA
jgi:hypothetical protein